MKTTILSCLLALGLPGASACSAQQEALPRVGQEPAATTDSGRATAHVVETPDDEEENEDEMDMDAELEEHELASPGDLQPLPEVYALQATKPGCCSGSKSLTETKCEAKGTPSSVNVNQAAQPYALFTAPSAPLAADGSQVLRIDEKDLKHKGKCLSIQPGQTVILDTKNGKQVVLRAAESSLMHTGNLSSVARAESTPGPSFMTLSQVLAAPRPGQAAGSKDLEQRVRELEKRLSEQDANGRESKTDRERALEKRIEELERALERKSSGGASKTPKSPFTELRGLGYAGDGEGKQLRFKMNPEGKEGTERYRVEAEAGRALAEKSRAMAQDQRRMAGEQRAQADRMRRQAQELGEQAHGLGGWVAPHGKTPMVPEPRMAPPAVAGPVGPEGVAPPAEPFTWYARTPTRARVSSPAPQSGERMELHQLLDEMRAQMDEMRKQMEALRNELEQAPPRGAR